MKKKEALARGLGLYVDTAQAPLLFDLSRMDICPFPVQNRTNSLLRIRKEFPIGPRGEWNGTVSDYTVGYSHRF